MIKIWGNMSDIERIVKNLNQILTMASWHYDEDAKENDEQVIDAVAHQNGLIVKKTIETLSIVNSIKLPS